MKQAFQRSRLLARHFSKPGYTPSLLKLAGRQFRASHSRVVSEQKKQIDNAHADLSKRLGQGPSRDSFTKFSWELHRDCSLNVIAAHTKIDTVTETAHNIAHDLWRSELKRLDQSLSLSQVKEWYEMLTPVFCGETATKRGMMQPWLGDESKAIVDFGELSELIARINNEDNIHASDLMVDMHYVFASKGWLRVPESRLVLDRLTNIVGLQRLNDVEWPSFFCPLDRASSTVQHIEDLAIVGNREQHQQWLLQTFCIESVAKLSALENELRYNPSSTLPVRVPIGEVQGRSYSTDEPETVGYDVVLTGDGRRLVDRVQTGQAEAKVHEGAQVDPNELDLGDDRTLLPDHNC